MANNQDIINKVLDRLEQNLIEIYPLMQQVNNPVNVIVPKETQTPMVINITIPPIVVNVPKQERPVFTIKSAPITVNASKQENPVVNIQLPKQKVAKVAREQEIINRDVSGRMIGTQSIQEFEYEDQK